MSTTESQTTPLSAEQMRPRVEKKMLEAGQIMKGGGNQAEIKRFHKCQEKMKSFNDDFLRSYDTNKERSEMRDYGDCTNEIRELNYVIRYEGIAKVPLYGPYVSLPDIKRQTH